MKKRLTLYLTESLYCYLDKLAKDKGLRSRQAAIEYILAKETNK